MISHHVLGFGSVEIGGSDHGMQAIEAQTKVDFMVQRLVVPDGLNTLFMIRKIEVGGFDILESEGGVPAIIYGASNSIVLRQKRCNVGQKVVLHVENKLPYTARFEACVSGEAIPHIDDFGKSRSASQKLVEAIREIVKG